MSSKNTILAAFAVMMCHLSLFADTLSEVNTVLDNNKNVFQQSGAEVDSLGERIRTKITFSWKKAFEYFNLAKNSTTNIIPKVETSTVKSADTKVEEVKQALSALGKTSSSGGGKKIIEAAAGFSEYSKQIENMVSDEKKQPESKARKYLKYE